MNSLDLINIPQSCGIYLFKDKNAEVLYVGKAKSLQSRVKSYFQNSSTHGPRTASMVLKISKIETIVTKTEIDALILESNFIKKYKPKYNILLRDDKHYPYIKLSIEEDFPTLSIVRRVEKSKSVYFGPYIPTSLMRGIIKQLYRMFPLRQSKDPLDGTIKRRPCLNFQIGRCLAPCAGKITKEDYSKIVKGVILFLKGRSKDLIELLTEEMKKASDQLNFEEAAKLRDQVNAIKKNIWHKQEIISTSLEEQDVVSYHEEDDDLCLQILFIRGGKIVGKREYCLKKQNALVKENIYSFLKQYYGNGEYIPDEIIIKDKIEDQSLLEQWLASLKGKSVKLTSPMRGRKFSLVEMTTENARLWYENNHKRSKDIIKHMKESLGLKKIPNLIESFDISNIAGKNPVGSMVVFKEGRSYKREYRRFKIKSLDTINDYKMISEVIHRRYIRLLNENKTLPDFILIDGGKGHLKAAMKVMEELNITDYLDVAAIAKGKERVNLETDEVFVNGKNKPVVFDAKSGSIKLFLQQVRDEAHRFAIEFHRSLRRKGIKSELSSIEGIGKKLRMSLLKHFGSVEKIKGLDVNKIMEVPGISEGKAQRIYSYFNKK